MTEAILVDRLTKRYGQHVAIQDLSFSVNPGEIVGFLGPNGAGKTTTLRILCGLTEATSGKAWISGISVAAEPHAARSQVGYLAERNPLPEEMRVHEYLHFRAQLKGFHGSRRKTRVAQVMKACQLDDAKTQQQLIGRLSLGYRQRVGLAEAILANPPLLFLDEPTTGLDPHQILTIRRLIHELRGTRTLVLSSHILSEVELVCDKVIIVHQGRVVAAGKPAELCSTWIPYMQYEVVASTEPSVVEGVFKRIDPQSVLVLAYPQGKTEKTVFRMKMPGIEERRSQLLAELHAALGEQLAEFSILKPSLEDLFLAATGHAGEAQQFRPQDLL